RDVVRRDDEVARAALDSLERACARLAIEIRREPLEATSVGGLCQLQGRWVIFLDPRTPAAEQVRLVARAVARFDTDALFLVPAARAAVERARDERPAVRSRYLRRRDE
ncbi:MAG: hypothetical protein IT379_23325, partial [Deltaproteobacteria bacterium]|nr:hypothetical protein [Deltaproteobacteria bacterium]